MLFLELSYLGGLCCTHFCPTSAWNALFSTRLLLYFPLFLQVFGDGLLPKRGPPGLSIQNHTCARPLSSSSPCFVLLYDTQNVIVFVCVSPSVQSLSHVRLCDPTDCSTPGFPVRHQLLELTQTHVHQVGDAIRPSHPLLSPSPPAFNLSQHQGLFQGVSSSDQVTKELELQLQHQSLQ